MRILFVHTIAPHKYGGGERWVVKAASGLHKNGHKVIVASWKNSLLLKHASEAGVETMPCNIYSDISLYQAFRLSRIIKKNAIDAVIVKRRDLAVAGIAAKWAHNPVVLVRSGSPPQRSAAKHAFLMRKLADGIVTNTQTIRDFYLENGLTKPGFVKVIYNGLNLFDHMVPFDFATKFPGKKIILAVGRVVADKGYFFVIDALEKLKDKHPEVLVYVIGEGKDKEKFLEYAQNKGVEGMICFAGYIDPPVPYMLGCDLFLHASLYEGMPNAPMEAMAYGKPVVMTQVNGADELSDYGKYARLIPSGNADAIASEIQLFLQKPEQYIQLGAQAREFVRKKFTMQIMIQQLEEYLLEKAKQKL